ncbi:AAA family ATPase [Bacillus haynesii]|uniref:AAA family ATPase n=1 Tax=Bacillus haynesii TaxID=1925021 RepID=UPI002282AD69|nr:AAA family ATPase [Bacillus haynesii]MCY8609940.1 AAA family ATPase [Bacillus haynesii]
MSVIRKIRIKGFQSHVDSDIDLGEGFNVITGPSDSGKTAVIRAVRWVAFNDPSGEAFVNQNVGEAEVSITIDSGQIITKKRRKGKTKYIIQQNMEDEGSLFEKSEVPEEVTALLGIRKEAYGDFETAVNFAYQLDPPFLISETASAGAKVLGKLAGTTAVDMAVKSINKDTVAARNERSRASQDIERINKELLSYSGLDEAAEKLEYAQYVLDKTEADTQELTKLEDIQLRYASEMLALKTATKKVEGLQIVPVLFSKMGDIEKARKQVVMFRDLQDLHLKAAATANDADKLLKTLEGIPAATEILSKLLTKQQKGSLLYTLWTEYTKYMHLANRAAETLHNIGDLDVSKSGLKAVESYLTKYLSIYSLYAEYRTAHKTFRTAQERLNDFRYLGEGRSLFERTEGKRSTQNSLLLLHEKFSRLAGEKSQAEKRLQIAENGYLSAQQEVADSYAAAGGICPLCEKPLDHQHH